MRTALLRILRWALMFLGLLIAVVTLTPLVIWWSGLLAGDWDAANNGVLIVLSSDFIDEQTLGVNSYWRVVYASRVYREGNYRKVIVAGLLMAPVMRDALVCAGVPAEKIVLENASTSTRENALFTAALVGNDPGPFVLVTSDLHMFRSRRVFDRAGLKVTGAPFPYGRKLGNGLWYRWDLFWELAIETGKIIVYKGRGWI